MCVITNECRFGEGTPVQSLQAKQEVTATSSFTPLGMASQTLGWTSQRLCRYVP